MFKISFKCSKFRISLQKTENKHYSYRELLFWRPRRRLRVILHIKQNKQTLFTMTEENKTGKPDMGVVSWRIGAERKKILTERFGTPSGQAAIEEVMNIYFDLYPALKAEMELLQTENRSLQEIISDLQTEVTSLQTASDTKLEGEIAVAKETIDALKREKEEYIHEDITHDRCFCTYC